METAAGEVRRMGSRGEMRAEVGGWKDAPGRTQAVSDGGDRQAQEPLSGQSSEAVSQSHLTRQTDATPHHYTAHITPGWVSGWLGGLGGLKGWKARCDGTGW
ncbi:hypothetical protein J3458_003029 [Metarhizium acridum]|uniref:uncharacterized protein n=1 Tax=Metarhizium acridum TaxID=92637 RepID=UPI001C6BF864|nr:hypothetical protein J3458_003029 [Metarhizium acridum]